MADDNLFDGSGKPDGKPAGVPNAPDPNAERFDKLERTVGQLGSSLSQFADKVTESLKPREPKAPTPPARTGEDLVQDFLTDPEKALESILARRPDLIQRVAREQIVADVGPYVQNDVKEKYESFTADARSRIDRTYGDGAFDELLAAPIEGIFKTMDGQGAGIGRGVRSTFDAVLRQASGDPEVIQKLWDRKQIADKKRAEVPSMVEGSGSPLRPKTQLTESDRQFISSYEKATGHKLDPKQLLDTLGKYDSEVGGWTAASMGSKNRLRYEDA